MEFLTEIFISNFIILIEIIVSLVLITTINKNTSIISLLKNNKFIFCIIVLVLSLGILKGFEYEVVLQKLTLYLSMFFISKYFLKIRAVNIIASILVILLIGGISETISLYILSNVHSMTINEYSNLLKGTNTMEQEIRTVILVSLLIFSGLVFFLKLTRFSFENRKVSLKSISLLFFNIVVGFLVAVPTVYLLILNDKSEGSIWYIIIDVISISLIVLLIIFNTVKILELNEKRDTVKNYELYTNTLKNMNRGFEIFKHDVDNFLQAMNGYIMFEDWEGLKKYSEDMSKLSRQINILNLLNPEIINNASIFGVVVSKYDYAMSKNINFNLEILTDISQINCEFFDLSRVIGILLDNAIEEAINTEKKEVRISFRRNFLKNQDEIEIFNCCSNCKEKQKVLKEIYSEGFTTKKGNKGVGLYEVNKIINLYKNIELSTKIEEDKFIQIIIIKDL